MALLNYLKSTILSKVVMAGTGIILVLFIMGHCLGNMQVLIGKETFNTYAHFLQSTGELLLIVRVVMIVSVLLHIITSVWLKFKNMAAKPVGYTVKRYVKARVTARNMLWTGVMVLAFLLYHLMHFTIGAVHTEHYGHQEYYESNVEVYQANESGEMVFSGDEPAKLENGKVFKNRHDVFYMVVKGFQQPLISLFYFIGVILLGFHLAHAIQSAFQTLGATGPKFTPWMIRISNLLSILLVICYLTIPVTILLGLVGGGI